MCGPQPANVDPSLLDGFANVDIRRIHTRGDMRRFADSPATGRAAATTASSSATDAVQEKKNTTTGGENHPRAERETPLQTVARYWHSFTWINDDKKRWSFKVAWELRRYVRCKRCDVIISSGPPMSGHMAVWLSQIGKTVPWIMDYRDPWYQAAAWIRSVQSPVKDGVESWLETRCLSAATAVVCATEAIGRSLGLRSPRALNGKTVLAIENGFDGAIRQSSPPTGRLALLYAGTLYLNRDPRPLLRALAALRETMNPSPGTLSFTIVGNWQAFDAADLPAAIEALGLGDTVRLVPPVPQSELNAFYEDANVLVNFAQQQPLQIPAKMFEYIAQRREVLLYAESDSATGVLCGRIPWVHRCDDQDIGATVQVLNRLYDRYVRRNQISDFPDQIISRYSRAGQLERYEALLKTAIHGEVG